MGDFHIKSLTKILEKNRSHYFDNDFYFSNFKNLGLFPVFEITLDNESILRSVKYEKFFLDDYQQITNKPSNLVNRKGRCNLEGESVFYGSLFVNDDIIPRIANIMEIERLKMLTSSIDFKFIHARYNIKETLNCLVIDFPSSEPKFELQSDIYKLINKNIKELNFQKQVLDLYKLIVAEFRKFVEFGKDLEYQFTASFTSYIFKTVFSNGKEFDAVIYPSVQVDGFTYNICIRESSLKKIEFKGAGIADYGMLNNKFSQKSLTELELQNERLVEVKKHILIKYL